MLLQRGGRVLHQARRLAVRNGRPGRAVPVTGVAGWRRRHGSGIRELTALRCFHASSGLFAVKPVLLADIGEGIVECEVIQWFVEPGARVEEFARLCEVQSDKASVEITSRFAGVVRKLHYEAGEMAKVGQPFVDIDIAEDVHAMAAAAGDGSEEAAASRQAEATPAAAAEEEAPPPVAPAPAPPPPPPPKKFAGSSLATPAVRHLSKELDVDIAQVDGTGKDGRVLKEDVHRFVEQRRVAAAAAAASAAAGPPSSRPSGALPTSIDSEDAAQQETAVPLAGTQLQMFRAMTKSLAIPHFLYADEVDISQLSGLRRRVNAMLAAQSTAAAADAEHTPPLKLSYLPFIIKAMSLALLQYPILNARVETTAPAVEAAGTASADTSAAAKPRLVYRRQHNIGVAMDTPDGLVVPVVRNVNARSVLSIAAELVRLQGLARTGRLAPADLQGGTITVSNIGNLGGTYVSPVIVEREVAILGVGRVRTVPAFADDADDEGTGATPPRIVKRHVCHFSLSADHRVVDGATAARAAEVMRQLVEQPDTMAVQLR